MNHSMAACKIIHLFSNQRISETLAQLLQVVIQSIHDKGLQYSAVPCDGLALTIQIVQV